MELENYDNHDFYNTHYYNACAVILTAIQDNIYLSWQAELLHWNCKKLGRNLDILIGYRSRPSDYALRLEADCGAILIEDTRKDFSYAPSIQPHLLSKYQHSGSVMLVDSDVLFKSFDRFPPSDGRTVTGSDCGNYLNASYVDGCDPDILHHLCTVSHIPPQYVRERPNVPGAQYILPHLFDAGFWQRVEENSNQMFQLMTRYKCKIHEIQSWTASMWAIWFELLRMEVIGEVTVETSPALDFCFATDPVNFWQLRDILHMAGVTRNMTGLFHKGDYTERPPWDCDLSHVKDDNCSWIYKEAVREYQSAKVCC